MLRSMKIYVPLLWGLCVLFPTESVTTSIPETKSTDATNEANNTARQPTTASVKALESATWNPEHRQVNAEKTPSPTEAHERSETSAVRNKTNSSESSRDGSVVVTAVAADTSSSRLPASTEAPAATTARGEAKLPTAPTTATTETPPSSAVTVARTSMTTTVAEAQPFPALNTARGEPSTAVTMGSTETHSAAVTTAKDEVHPSPSVTIATGEAQSLHYTTMTDTLNHTADQLHQSSTSSFSNENATTTFSTAFAPTVAVSTPIIRATSESPSTTSLNTQNVSRPATSSPTSREAETFPSTSTELSSTRTSASSTSTLNSTTELSETTRSNSTTTDSPSSTTGNSTSPAGILLTRTRSAPAATVAPCKPAENPPNNHVQPCSTRSVANQCLIIIGSLAALATTFMVSTIVLCAKLSSRTYKVKKTQQGTEMMCISALLPEKTHTYTRQRNPVSNGILVFPGGGDSDEEGGDNLTLSSFLPDNDRYV